MSRPVRLALPLDATVCLEAPAWATRLHAPLIARVLVLPPPTCPAAPTTLIRGTATLLPMRPVNLMTPTRGTATVLPMRPVNLMTPVRGTATLQPMHPVNLMTPTRGT